MASRPGSIALCVLAGLCAPAAFLAGAVQGASASENQARGRDAKVVASIETPADATPVRPGPRKSAPVSARGPYYVDFRARTAASWGHAFVWYGKTSERQVEVAGLTPAGDVGPYILGYVTWVPSETGASYGDLDPEYLEFMGLKTPSRWTRPEDYVNELKALNSGRQTVRLSEQ
jgi:hypothetical protein